ncbi:disease resistance protein At4g27190-like [Rhodamnia argentea]|uniref:Disease resistance protein At4g27190-like n=1 Tax=Rhodamnia argentea TaxID=178133 RepID=A0ABM3HGL5_9MYRT|nr:disease resistance protein At4g27190-like [Rhodamnia argentea]
MSIECGLPTVSVWQLLKEAYNLLKDPVVYAMSSKSFFDSLKEEVGKLENEARRVEALAQAARNNLRNLNEVFTEWKKRADKASEDARNRWEAFEDSKSCCYGRLPNPYCHYKFSTEAEAEIKVIQDLAQESIRFRGVDDICLVGPAPAPTSARREGKDVVQPTTAAASISSASMSVKLRDRGVFESRASMIRNIMDALADNSKSVVGVYGMGGVGKSTLLNEVKRILSEGKLFDWVAKADVSKNPDNETIQGEIAAGLELTDMETKKIISVRAELLRNRLEKEEKEKKKVLIILDNLWEGLDLNKVGIPCGDDNKARGCKLLLTSRDLNVLQRGMGCDKAFPLGGLLEEEARALFERLVGDKVHQDEFRPLVNEALDRCAGVPFLIIAMAKRFKNAKSFEWKDALSKMDKFVDRENNGLIGDMLKWSYDKLEPEVKALLRLCVVSSVSKPSLDDLVRYGFGLGLFEQVGSLEEATNRLRSHIRALQASALLLDSEDVEGFKIHDLVCEFVASVSWRDHHPLLMLEDKVKSVTELPKDKLKNCEAMCFPNMKELPQELNCPELRILLLSTNDDSLPIPDDYLPIPDSYFNSMRNLMVLNLIGIRLTCSPSPFQSLVNLHALCFQDCSFEDVAILGNLKGLQILSIVDSEIQRLPKEIGQLVELRLLELSRCSNLEIIEPGVLESLTNLEELYMEHSFDQWNAVEQTPATNASLIELNNMKNLRTLYVSIPNPSALPRHLDVEKLTKYKIRIGDAWRWSVYKGSRTLELELNSKSDILWEKCIQSVLCKTNDLFLKDLNRIEQSICRLSQEGFPQLKHLEVEDSSSLHYILDCSSLPTFKALESLLLKCLINLEKICHNRISIESFSTLKVVQVESCDKIEVLFPRSVVRRLPYLEKIKVKGCRLMRGIVEADDGHGKLELPKLRVLKLHELPNIQNFITACSAPSSSTSNDQVGTQIAFLNGRQVAFPSLETLEVNGLDNVGFMFSPSVVKSLANLRKLAVNNCKKMKAIIMEEEGLGVEISETLSFPMLTDLLLTNLGRWTSFFLKKCRSPDRVQSCSSVLFNREVSFPFLDSLTIEGLLNLKEIWSDESPLESSNLRSLKVVRCESLLKVISSKSLVKLHKLQTLSINDCSLVQEIFYLEGPSTNGDVETLSELTTLELNKLGSLRRIWKENPSGIVSFHKLQEFKLDGCDKLEFIFFPSMVNSLAQPRDLTVSNCKKMEAIIAEEERLGMEISKTLAFSMLTNLRLDRLESLKCFSRRKCKINFFFLLLKIFV